MNTEHRTLKKAVVIAVGNQKGGVGKTTNAVHLATALAERGRKCVIIDLDMNHGATRHFKIEADGYLGTFEVMLGVESPLTVLVTKDEEEAMPEGVHLIPSRRKLENIDEALATKCKFVSLRDTLEGPIALLSDRYDYIFLDTAPNATTPTKAAYTVADWFILTALPEPFAVEGLNDALTDIQDAQARANPRLRLLGVVLSGVDKRTTLSSTLTRYVDEAFGDGREGAKFKTTIGRSTVVPRVQKEGGTLFQRYPHHPVTEQYRALAAEVEGRLGMTSENNSSQLTVIGGEQEVVNG